MVSYTDGSKIEQRWGARIYGGKRGTKNLISLGTQATVLCGNNRHCTLHERALEIQQK